MRAERSADGFELLLFMIKDFINFQPENPLTLGRGMNGI